MLPFNVLSHTTNALCEHEHCTQLQLRSDCNTASASTKCEIFSEHFKNECNDGEIVLSPNENDKNDEKDEQEQEEGRRRKKKRQTATGESSEKPEKERCREAKSRQNMKFNFIFSAHNAMNQMYVQSSHCNCQLTYIHFAVYQPVQYVASCRLYCSHSFHRSYEAFQPAQMANWAGCFTRVLLLVNFATPFLISFYPYAPSQRAQLGSYHGLCVSHQLMIFTTTSAASAATDADATVAHRQAHAHSLDKD